jgi:glutaminase
LWRRAWPGSPAGPWPLTVSATELAVMGATLADGGVNPLTGERVVDAAVPEA